MVAFNGVPVEGCTLANQDGTSRALPITQRYLAWPSMATRREATIPRLAPAPTTLPAHFHPLVWKAIENDALFDIYESFEECLFMRIMNFRLDQLFFFLFFFFVFSLNIVKNTRSLTLS